MSISSLPPEILSQIIHHAQPPHSSSTETKKQVFRQLALVNSAWHGIAREEYSRWLSIHVEIKRRYKPLTAGIVYDSFAVRTVGDLSDLGRVRFVDVVHSWPEEMPEQDLATHQIVKESF